MIHSQSLHLRLCLYVVQNALYFSTMLLPNAMGCCPGHIHSVLHLFWGYHFLHFATTDMAG